MALLQPFRALRPGAGHAAGVVGPPYDVVDTAAARALAAGEPRSILHVTRPEIDLPDDADPSAPFTHERARHALDALVRCGVLRTDEAERLFVYRLHHPARGITQTGVVGCAAVADYLAGTIAVHEHTRPDKEADRVDHLDALSTHDEPVFLMYRDDTHGAGAVAQAVEAVCAGRPVEDVVAHDGVRHTLWAAAPGDTGLESAFARIPRLYVADGHHRSAAAALVARRRGGSGLSTLFPVVAFPASELTVLPYYRVLADLGRHDDDSLLATLTCGFDVRRAPRAVSPDRPHVFGLLLRSGWHELVARPATTAPAAEARHDVLAGLDVSLLQHRVLAPLLGIDDPRRDRRLRFVGGGAGTAALERLVGKGEAAAAFTLHPTSTAQVMAVADLGEVMPPKSTWFEPKLASGLFLHPFGDAPLP